jgi:mannose-1-phosphate guanylyltransferase / phosphomannomutase
MTTVLFADRDGASLGALSAATVPALLPLQGVPCLERALEALVKAGTRSALLVVGPRASEIERRFGKGIRWGIALQYVRREEDESPGDVLRRLEQRLDGETLLIRGDVGTHTAIGEFLAEVAGRRGPIVAGMVQGRPAGLWRLLPGALKKTELPREPGSGAWARDPDHVALPLMSEVTLIDSVASYRASDRAEKPAVSPRATVDPRARLLPGTTVAEEAIVSAGASLAETSVLQRTVIPAGVALEGAVVSGNLVVLAASGTASLLTDRLPPSAGPRAAGLGSRLGGLVALAFSLPLWPVAFFWSLIANAGRATRDVVLSGNLPSGSGRAPFKTFCFETAVPVLRDLPLLLAVVSGRLALTGVTPLTPEEEAGLKEPWEKVRLEAPAGLVSLARLIVPASAPAEVARLVDAFEARRPTPGLLRLALAAFFSGRAWTAQRAFNPDVPPEEVKA